MARSMVGVKKRDRNGDVIERTKSLFQLAAKRWIEGLGDTIDQVISEAIDRANLNVSELAEQYPYLWFRVVPDEIEANIAQCVPQCQEIEAFFKREEHQWVKVGFALGLMGIAPQYSGQFRCTLVVGCDLLLQDRLELAYRRAAMVREVLGYSHGLAETYINEMVKVDPLLCGQSISETRLDNLMFKLKNIDWDNYIIVHDSTHSLWLARVDNGYIRATRIVDRSVEDNQPVQLDLPVTNILKLNRNRVGNMTEEQTQSNRCHSPR